MCLITPTLLSLSLSLSSSTRVYVFTLLCILSVDKLPAATTCRAGNPRPGHRHQHPPSVSRLPGPFSQNRQLLLSVGSNDFCRVVFFVLLLLLLFFFPRPRPWRCPQRRFLHSMAFPFFTPGFICARSLLRLEIDVSLRKATPFLFQVLQNPDTSVSG